MTSALASPRVGRMRPVASLARRGPDPGFGRPRPTRQPPRAPPDWSPMLIVPDSRKRTPVARRLAVGGALLALVWLGARGAGPVPPVGPLLDPWNGAWGLAATANLPPSAEDSIPGLRADVRVVYDD